MRKTGLFAGQAGEQRVEFMIQRIPDAIKLISGIVVRGGDENLIPVRRQQFFYIRDGSPAAAFAINSVDDQNLHDRIPKYWAKCFRSIA